ncbi:Uma2 family endonuclease [Oculatella sp. LEGE 06141]|uniref:Uma2 family endonuclease n=1 Tax=Oculatella sp. LEGE 06141 TaxID=1828648 RepID=UPI0018824D2F|nr:Uma2 family endonuclease [Oculatella sp. LEGE 06141]MBE9179566.1 Uma2 family endonuclease [Oculatella sp. LEGE 06141]
MVSQLESSGITYPDSDGKPVADNTRQFRWIVVIQQNLEWLFADYPEVFVAGDLLWYPVEGNNKLCTAPDVMVALGRPKGDRGSYKQWEENNMPPQVVFEILSPSNTAVEMDKKLLFYDRHGVEEYYIYNPDTNELTGWQRTDGLLDAIEPIAGWVSPRLGIRFEPSVEPLQLYRPDGARFLSYSEIAQQAAAERQRAEAAEAALAEEQRRSQALADRLKAAGIDPIDLIND